MSDTVLNAAELGRKQDFMIARAEAIEAYSRLEQILCEAFAYFGDMSNHTAGTIFFRISAARSRREMLDKLKVQKAGVGYSPYWNSILGLLAPLEDERNKVVHWALAVAIYVNMGTQEHRFYTMLKTPNFWSWTDKTPELFQEDLEIFAGRCQLVGESVRHFLALLSGKLDGAERDTWREICQQPLTYQLPPDHPLYLPPIAPPPLRRPWQG